MLQVLKFFLEAGLNSTRPHLRPPIRRLACSNSSSSGCDMAQQDSTRRDNNPLSGDIHEPLSNAQLRLGWETGREHDYWIPPADIDGEVPRELYGTLLRNGPGISEVYGNKLLHRELMCFSIT